MSPVERDGDYQDTDQSIYEQVQDPHQQHYETTDQNGWDAAGDTQYVHPHDDYAAETVVDPHGEQLREPELDHGYSDGEDAAPGVTYDEARVSTAGQLLDTGSLSLKRMPMLHMIMERLATNCADHMRHIAPTQMYFSVSGVESAQTTVVLEGYAQNGIAAVFHVPEWDSSVVIALDRSFIYTTIESIFGGDGSELETTTARPFSSIEMRVATNLVQNIARALEAAFSSVSKIHLKFERIETRMDFASIGRRTNQAVAARFSMQAINRTGEMCILVPQSVISSMRNVLGRPVANDPVVRDPAWTNHLQQEVQKANVDLYAILGECTMTLGDLENLHVGQFIQLDQLPKLDLGTTGLIPSKIATREKDLFWCGIGKSNGQIMLKILEPISAESETLDELFSR